MTLNVTDLTKLLVKKQSKYCPTVPFTKQLAFSMITKKEALFGGSLGGGKSEAVLQLALSYVHIPGFSCLILRKSVADLKLSGALLNRMQDWMAPWIASKEVRYAASEHKFVFKTYHPVTGERCKDAYIQFGYIGESNARTRYQGAEFNLCVHGDTLVVMGDGSHKKIEEIKVGDFVSTLNGPRRVSRTHRVKKEAVALLTKHGYQIQGATHRVLASPSQKGGDTSKLSSFDDKLSSQTLDSNYGSSTHLDSQCQDLLHKHEPEKLFPGPSLTETNECILYTNLDTCSEEFDRGHQGLLLLDSHFCTSSKQQTLVSSEWVSFQNRRENVDDLLKLQDTDYQEDYSTYLHQYGELQSNLGLGLQELSPSLGCVKLSFFSLQDTASVSNHLQTTKCYHPYTCDEIGQFDLQKSSSLLVPLNCDLDLCDITVEGESHYMTVCDSVNTPINSNCIFDEVCQHTESDYTYLFTRLRKCICPTHQAKDEKGNPIYFDDCQECQWAKLVPTIMRATCNPEGIGFAWVKKRFKIQPNMSQSEADDLGVRVKWIGKDPERPFLPSTFLDNPHLDHKTYGEELKKNLTDEMYEALVLGSWGVVPNARFKKKWKRVYSQNSQLLFLGRNTNGPFIDPRNDYQKIFLTVDTATTAAEGPGDVDMFPTSVKNPSWTVICAWGLTKCFNLIWLDMYREREEIPDVVAALKRMYETWNPSEAIVEENGVGKGVSQFASRMGMNIVGLHKERDKVENATEAILQMKAGRIWLPEYADWLEEAESEIFTWQGHPKETDDIVDNLAHAVNHVDWTKASDHLNTMVAAPLVVSTDRLPAAFTSKFRYKTF